MIAPRLKARIAGFFYLITFLLGALDLAILQKLVVDGDAGTTARNILIVVDVPRWEEMANRSLATA